MTAQRSELRVARGWRLREAQRWVTQAETQYHAALRERARLIREYHAPPSGWTYAEIAEVLGISRQQVEKLHNKGEK